MKCEDNGLAEGELCHLGVYSEIPFSYKEDGLGYRRRLV
jgi:hypothetical protein